MRVNNSFLQPRHSIINAARVNDTLAKRGMQGGQRKGGRPNRDRVDLSPQGKLASMIDNLRKQKDVIIERKNDLIKTTLENGGKVEDIKDQLKYYGKQMEQIDKQISDMYTQQAKQAAEKEKDKKTGKTHENKSKEQKETEYLSNLAAASQSLKTAETVTGIKERTEGEARVKECEVSQGRVHIEQLESRELQGIQGIADMIDNETNAIDRKRAEIAQLWDKASGLGQQQSEQLKESREALEDNREISGDPVKDGGESVNTGESADTVREIRAAGQESAAEGYHKPEEE